MRIELEKRPDVSKLFGFVSPLLALVLTLTFGAIMFAMLGKDPAAALSAFFVEPLLEVWSLHELAIKAAPLILIAVGLAVCYRSNNWNIGARDSSPSEPSPAPICRSSFTTGTRRSCCR